jgi:LPXTG-motif cell wall-anchored protein
MKLSRPLQIVLGILVLLALVVVIVVLALPALRRLPTQPVVQAGPTRTPHSSSISARPSSTPIGAVAPTNMAIGGTTTGTNPLGTGGGETLPTTDSGLPWLIPVGVVLLLAVAWWRWRRARAGTR